VAICARDDEPFSGIAIDAEEVMRKTLCALVFVTTAFVAPPAVRLRFAITEPTALGKEGVQLRHAILRGLYADSLVVQGSDSMLPGKGNMRDTAFFHHMVRSYVVTGELEESGDLVVARLSLMNILAQSVVGPDTIRATRASLDSAGFELGRTYARRLARTVR
jgi:hypothetical protein